MPHTVGEDPSAAGRGEGRAEEQGAKRQKRNVFVWSAVQDGWEAAGCWQSGRITCDELREWIEICWSIRAQNDSDGFPVHDWGLYQLANPGSSSMNVVDQHNFVGEELIPQGHFVILRPGPYGHLENVSLADSEHSILLRAMSRISTLCTPRTHHFRERLKERDGGCCISGETPEDDEDWSLYEPAHIFPRYAVGEWLRLGFSSELTDTHRSIGETKIDSVQNGLMLRADLHRIFDSYKLGINPDRNYKTYRFGVSNRFDGQQVNFRVPPGHPERPLDSLLRWHFRQCVLSKIKASGASKDDEDHDWADPEVWHLDKPVMYATEIGKQRLEVELAHRLSSFVTTPEI